MASKIKLTEAQKAREARLNALMRGETPSLPPVQLKTTHMSDRNGRREAEAEARGS